MLCCCVPAKDHSDLSRLLSNSFYVFFAFLTCTWDKLIHYTLDNMNLTTIVNLENNMHMHFPLLQLFYSHKMTIHDHHIYFLLNNGKFFVREEVAAGNNFSLFFSHFNTTHLNCSTNKHGWTILQS